MSQSTPFGAVEFAANPEPRCPCVLVLDCSASMAGQRLQELQKGLAQFREELLGDPLARKRVEVAVVTFGGSVKLACDFTTIEHFEPPRLQAVVGGFARAKIRQKHRWRVGPGVVAIQPVLARCLVEFLECASCGIFRDQLFDAE